MKQRGASFSKREWFLLIFVIILVQFMVHYAAFLYSGNKSALGYVSISGTIVSIILALLAIIYAYYQSTSQNNASTSLNSQIDKLISIVDQIKTSKVEFSDELQGLSEIREKLDSSISIQERSHHEVKQLSKTVDDLLENNLSVGGSFGEEDDYFTRLVVGGNNIIHLSLLVIKLAADIGVSYKNLWNEIGSSIVQSLEGKELSPDIEEYYRGALLSIVNILSAFGYLEQIHDEMTIVPTDEFASNLSRFFEFIRSREDSEYIRVMKTIDRLSDKCQ